MILSKSLVVKINNTIPNILTYFDQNQTEPQALKFSGSEVSLADVRNQTILKLLEREDLTAASIKQASKNEFKTEAKAKIAASNDRFSTLHLDTGHKQALDELTSGKSIFSIVKTLGKSLEQVFTLMRLIEARLKSPDSQSPSKKISKNAWDKLNKNQQLTAEMLLYGFSYEEIQNILDARNERVGKVKNIKPAVLNKLNLSFEEFEEISKEIQNKNSELPNEYLRKDRLIHIAFDRNDEAIQDANWNSLADEFETCYKKLPDTRRAIVEMKLDGLPHTEIKTALTTNDTTITTTLAELRAELRKVAKNRCGIKVGGKNSKGETNNVFPFVIDFFTRESQKVAELFTKRNDKSLQLNELKIAVVLDLIDRPGLKDSKILASIEKLCKKKNCQTSTEENQQKLSDIKTKLPTKQREVLELIESGTTLLDIAMLLERPLEDLFTPMRYFEKLLAPKNDFPPIKEFDLETWQTQITDTHKKVLELFCLGFDTQDIAQITRSSAETVTNYKALALKRLGYDHAKALKACKKLQNKNLDQVNIEVQKQRLIYYIFEHEDFDREDYFLGDLNFDQIHRGINLLLGSKAISDPQRETVKALLEIGHNVREIAQITGLSDVTVATHLKSTGLQLKKLFEDLIQNSPPAEEIDRVKWTALDSKAQFAFRHVLYGRSYDDILALDPSFGKAANAGTAARRAVRGLDLTTVQFKELKQKKTIIDKNRSPELFRQNFLQMVLPKDFRNPYSAEAKRLEFLDDIYHFTTRFIGEKYGQQRLQIYELRACRYSNQAIADKLQMETSKVKDAANNLKGKVLYKAITDLCRDPAPDNVHLYEWWQSSEEDKKVIRDLVDPDLSAYAVVQDHRSSKIFSECTDTDDALRVIHHLKIKYLKNRQEQ